MPKELQDFLSAQLLKRFSKLPLAELLPLALEVGLDVAASGRIGAQARLHIIALLDEQAIRLEGGLK